MHRTLKAETTRPPAQTHASQQSRFLGFQREYNQERQHEALALKPPGRIYKPSVRKYTTQLPEVEYPSHFEVRQVGSGGVFRWHSTHVFVSQSLVGERIGLVEVEDGLWRVYFSSVELGIFDATTLKKDAYGRVKPAQEAGKV